MADRVENFRAWQRSLLDRVSLVVGADEPVALNFRGNLGRCLVLVWNALTKEERRRFMAALDLDTLNFQPKIQQAKRDRAEEELIQIIEAWPSVLEQASKEQRSFALSIMKVRKKAGWWPSEKQEALMRAMWAERSQAGAEAPVVDDLEVLDE